MPSILIIDDDAALLNTLTGEIGSRLHNGEAEIRTWVPTIDDADPQSHFAGLVDNDTILVVTDYDLTAHGLTGLFGASIVGWCQARAIPVGDFSRGNAGTLPKEPNLFELRVPTEPSAAAQFIIGAFRGFKAIRDQVSDQPQVLEKKRSPAAVLAAILGVPTAESQFGLYGTRLGATNAALMDRILRTTPRNLKPDLAERRTISTYIVGHLLLNAVLRFPGPILSSRALVAYVGVDKSETDAIAGVFPAAKYDGPFGELGAYFWLSKVDERLQELTPALPQGFTAETHGEQYREALEIHLARKLNRHDCPRCAGQNGGFLCPLTDRTVCQRRDCSVGSTNLIPPGARVCRIERDYYDEWAPMLGT